MAEQGQDDGQLLQAAKKLPWEARIAHKNWKVRNDAYLDLSQLCKDISDSKDPKLREYGPLFVKAVSDSNANAQEKALDALIEFQKASDVDAGRFAKGTCNAIVAKCLTGRTKTLEKSQQAFLLWVELEAVEPFMDAMDVAIKSKVNKAVIPAVDAVFQCLSEFGVKVVPPKRVLKLLAELLEHADDKIRNSAKGLAVELCKWIGKPAVQGALFDKLRDTVKKDIEEEFDRRKGEKAKVSRYIRSEQENVHEEEAVSVVEGPSAIQEDESSGPSEVDAWELMDPVDILSKLDRDWGEGVLKITKWSDRRDKVAELTNLAKATRLAKGDFQDVTRALKKLIGDVNVAVVVEAVTAAGNLARGLRNDYSAGSRFLLPVILEKFKEKKKNVVDALHTTLDTMHMGGCISLGDALEDLKVALQSKVPSVRSEALKWATRCFERSKKADVLKVHKEYIPFLVEKGLGDGTVDVRDAAFDALAAIGKKAGMKPLERALEKLDDVKKKKLTEMINDAALATSAAAAPTAATARVNSGASSSSTTAEAVPEPAKRTAAGMLAGKRPMPRIGGAKKPGGGSGGASKKVDGGGGKPGSVADSGEDERVSDMSKEEVESRVAPLLPDNVLETVKSEKWQERSEALQRVKKAVEEMAPDALSSNGELLVRLLAVLPGFGEKNQQVLKLAFEIIADIAKRATTFLKRCVHICLAGVADKIADIKLKLAVAECLTAFAEAVGPQFVFDKLATFAKEHKNPKVLAESFLWLAKAVDDFGTGHVKLKELIDFCKDSGLASSTPAVRTGAAKLLGAVHKWVGPDLKQFLNDIKPALMTMVETEFARNPYEGPAAAPKLTIKSAGEGAAAASGGGDGGLPREDISKKLTDELLDKMKSNEWKVRQETIQEITKILEEANKRILPTGTGELFTSLKGRLNDSNKNLIVMALDTIGNIAGAMGAATEKHSRNILADVLKCLTDKANQIRVAVLKCLDAWLAVVPFEKMIPYCATALQDPKLSAEGRKDLFSWCSKQVNKAKDHNELMQMLAPTASGLQDKGSDVRKGAEEFLAELVKCCGYDAVAKASKGVKGAALLTPVLERNRPADDAPSDSKSESSVEAAPSRPGSAASRRNAPVNRSTSAKGTAASRQKEADAQRDKDMLGQPLFKTELLVKTKAEREKSYPKKNKFEEPREEQARELEEEMGRVLRDDLRVRLFSTDFKKQVEGLEILQKAIPAQVGEIIEALDLLLRWSVLRLCEGNTTSLLKVLEVMPLLVQALNQEGYMFTEWEAQFFIPCLVEKSGHNMEKVREKMRDVTRGLCSVYPVSKLLPHLVEGTRSKNNRTKIECVEHIEYLLDRNGIEIIGSTKALQVVAGLTSEKDAELRRVTLNCLATAFKILGDDIWKLVGKLSEAQKGLLDDKFKWTVREMEKKKEGRPGEGRAAARRMVRENGSEATDQSGEQVLRSSTNSVNTLRASHEHVEQEAAVNIYAKWDGPQPATWAEGLDYVERGVTLEQAVDGMKLICHDLVEMISGSDPTAVDAYVKEADHLVSVLSSKIPLTFNVVLSGGTSRPCKYVLNTLMQLYQSKKMAHAVSDGTMKALISELLLWLLHEQVGLAVDGSTLIKALNVLMLKILENAERTSGITVLISLLRPLDPTKGPSPTPQLSQEEAAGVRGAKFSDLVVKCLIKQTKALHITINEVDLDCLLESIFLYLQELGMDEIRRRAGADDKPLRMVKTVLHELVKVKGPAIKGHLSRVPIDSDPQPIILAYIDLNLQTLAASGQLPAANGTRDFSNGNVSSSVQGVWTSQLKEELSQVFKKIGDKQTSALGLTELYQFMHMHPQVDVFSQLQNASEAFRTYIRDGLAQVERNMNLGAAPPLTPPAASMTSHAHAMSTPTAYGNLKEKPHVEVPNADYASGRAGAEWRDDGNARGGAVPVASSGIESWRDRLKNINAGSTNSNASASSFQGFVNSPREQGASRVAEIRSRMEQFKHNGNGES